MTAGNSDQQGGRKRLPRITGWVVILAGLTFGAGYLYYMHLQDQRVFIDTYYFRTLQEVATEFNNNLGQLVSLHEYGESKSTIQSIFPSYQKYDEPTNIDGRPYRLEANRVTIHRKHGGERQSFFVSISDLLPEPSNDFVLYVIADSENRVLSSTGGASGLSLIDTGFVSRAIQLRESQDWLKLASKQGVEEPDPDQSLPGYSTQVDVKLTTGTSRLFVLPFRLQHEIGAPINAAASSREDYQVGGVPLYLLGLQPEIVIDSYDNRRWNLSLLLLSLAALVFLWTVMRLLMLSRHQPLGNGFYRITVGASYLTFILLVGLLVAFAHRNSEIAIKQGKARELIRQGQAGLSQDLQLIFSALDGYHRFYGELLTSADDVPPEVPEDDQTPEGIGAPPYEKSTLVVRTAKRLAKGEFDGTIDHFRNVVSGGENLEACAPPESDDTALSRLSYDDTLPPFSYVNVYGPCTDVSLTCLRDPSENPGQDGFRDPWEVSETFQPEHGCSFPADGRLLLVFLMNEEGRQIRPAFYYAENNKMPESYPLAHRDYFRRVRDQAGWSISLKEPHEVTRPNVYIQRLLNLNTGTRGTTIGMPLRAGGAVANEDGSSGFVLGADIELPSLSLGEWDDPQLVQDMVVMVIDRVSGQVLYHMDRSRSMIENLYRAGRSSAEISQSIRSGRFRPVSGYYHGARGEFVAAPLPVTQWAMVVFIPDAGTDSLMTNTFLVSSFGMAATLFSLLGLLALLRRYLNADEIKMRWGIPAAVNRHGVMLYTSILITAVYVSYWLGEIVGLQTEQASEGWSSTLSLVAVAVVLLWGYSVLRRLRRHDRLRAQLERNAVRGTVMLFAAFASIGIGLTAYLHYIGNKPDQGLTWYYKSLHEARLNQEATELREIALTRYPNSIKLHGHDPLSLLPISDGWRAKLSNRSASAREKPRPDREHVLPEDVGTFSQFTAATGAYDWIVRYMLGLAPTGRGQSSNTETDAKTFIDHVLSPVIAAYHFTVNRLSDPMEGAAEAGDGESDSEAEDRSPVARFVILYALAYLVLCVLWHLFFRWVIGARLMGPPGLIQHLKHIVERNVPERDYDPRRELVVDLHCGSHAGYDLSALLLRCSVDPPAGADESEASGASDELDSACRGVAEVLRGCPWLQSESHSHDWFPGARISFHAVADPSLHHEGSKRGGQQTGIQLSDLDVCLSDAELRPPLLRLIRHLKARCLAGELAELRLHLGFHSYEALLLKAHNIESDRAPLTAAEFAGWAETLMDFTVDVPRELTAELDADFVDYECQGSGLLRRLSGELLGPNYVSGAGWRQRRRWLNLRDADKTGAEWSTINCILLKAGALFRNKWESCSSAEKLALYFLAKRKRVNTANAQLLEQLALQGLIRVDHGAVRIVNNSFAYFARHAEDTSTLKHLVEVGGVGAWQDYRLPVTLVVLLLLGGIAFTSGSSLYMIAASLLGLLATLGSLTSSAQMIRENLR